MQFIVRLFRYCLVPVAVVAAGCDSSLDLPTTYYGRVHDVRFVIPARYVLMPVRYDNEDDWHPPAKPSSNRTFADNINLFEFFIDLDRPDTLVDVNSTKGRWPPDDFSSSGVLNGHLLGASAYSGGIADDPLGVERLRLNMMQFDAMSEARTVSDMFGLKARQADRSSAQSQESLEHMGRADLELYGRSDQTLIRCDYRFTLPPRREMSTCEITVVDPVRHLILRLEFDRVDLPKWRSIRSSLLTVVSRFTPGISPG